MKILKAFLDIKQVLYNDNLTEDSKHTWTEEPENSKVSLNKQNVWKGARRQNRMNGEKVHLCCV